MVNSLHTHNIFQTSFPSQTIICCLALQELQPLPSSLFVAFSAELPHPPSVCSKIFSSTLFRPACFKAWQSTQNVLQLFQFAYIVLSACYLCLCVNFVIFFKEEICRETVTKVEELLLRLNALAELNSRFPNAIPKLCLSSDWKNSCIIGGKMIQSL